MPAPVPARRSALRPVRFLREESGAGTALALFGILVCLMLAGLSIDFTNAWRHREILRLSADVAAHAGASTLAEEGSRLAALAVATGATELNTPTRGYGRTILDPFEDIQALEYDPETNRIAPGDTPNAVSVHLQRSARVQNPVPTYLLRLVGRRSWDISVTSVAAVVPTERCRAGDGLYSHAGIGAESALSLGRDVCLHGQKGVDLPGQGGFDKGAGLSMPDMADCQGGCNEIANPGFAAAATEANLVMTRPAALIGRLAAAFVDGKGQQPEEKLFFDQHPLAEDLSALDELGVDTSELETGDVIGLTAEQVTRARGLPAGLVYQVGCAVDEAGEGGTLPLGGRPVEGAAAAGAVEDTSGTDAGAGGGLDGVPAGGGAEPLLAEAQQLQGFVLVTDCRLHFTALADIRGALILSTQAEPGVAVTADPGASAGDPAGNCRAADQSLIMAMGDLDLPAGFTASNVAFVTAGKARLGGLPAGTAAAHRGLAIHAGDAVTLEGGHAFKACGTAPAPLLPALNVIKLVIPVEPLQGQR
jgi:hypothetical protein